MSSKDLLSKLYRELLAIIFLFGIIAVFLILERQGFHAPAMGEEVRLLDEDTWYEFRNDKAGKIDRSLHKALLIYDAMDEESSALKDNIQYVLRSLFVQTDSLTVVQERSEDLQENTKETELPDADVSEKKTQNLDAVNHDKKVNKIESIIGTEENKETNSDENKGKETEEHHEKVLYRPEISLPLSEYQDLIICLSNLTFLNVDMDVLLAWVADGGHILFAETLEKNEYLPIWYPILGIMRNSEIMSVAAESIQFSTTLMAGADKMEFSDDVISCQVLNPKLESFCKIHAVTADDDEIPLMWEFAYGNGSVFVCNADMMQSKVDRGIVAAVYSRFYPAFAYPVINAAVYCIDDCPSPAPAGFEKNILSQYGYTVADFFSNVWMPAMQDIAKKYGVRFSTFAIQTYEDDVDGPFANTDDEESASYYTNLILNMGGEIGIHGYNHQPLVPDDYEFDKENSGYTPWKNVKNMIASLKENIRYVESLYDGLYVESYVAPSNVISAMALQEMLAQLPDIRVYAGVYSGTPDQFIQEFSVLDNGVVFVPRLTADMQMEDSEWWTQINELNYHYVESNFIHPDDILDEERSDGGDFEQMLSGYEEMIRWNADQGLRVSTISEAGAAVQRYANLSVSQKLTENELEIRVTGLIDEAYMMLRTNGKRPMTIEGGSMRQLSDEIYILEINEETVKIKLVDRV